MDSREGRIQTAVVERVEDAWLVYVSYNVAVFVLLLLQAVHDNHIRWFLRRTYTRPRLVSRHSLHHDNLCCQVPQPVQMPIREWRSFRLQVKVLKPLQAMSLVRAYPEGHHQCIGNPGRCHAPQRKPLQLGQPKRRVAKHLEERRA